MTTNDPVTMLHGEEGQSILNLPASRIVDALRRSGCIRFSGFAVDEDTFRRFCERFAERFVLDLGSSKYLDERGFRPDAAFAQMIVASDGVEQDLHQENGTWADYPDVLWFHCERPAENGGETKLADGIRIWRELKESTRQLFLAEDLLYVQQLPAAFWRGALGLLFGSGAAHMRLAGLTFRFDDDDAETLRMEYRTKAVRPTARGGELAFVNSIRGPYQGEVCLADGRPIPGEVMQDIVETYARCTLQVKLLAGEVLMIDNTRFLHARTAFTDAQRRVRSAMAMSTLARGSEDAARMNAAA